MKLYVLTGRLEMNAFQPKKESNYKHIFHLVIIIQLTLILVSSLITHFIFHDELLTKKLIINGVFSFLLWLFYLPVVKKVTTLKSVFAHLGAYFSTQILMLIILAGHILSKT